MSHLWVEKAAVAARENGRTSSGGFVAQKLRRGRVAQTVQRALELVGKAAGGCALLGCGQRWSELCSLGLGSLFSPLALKVYHHN